MAERYTVAGRPAPWSVSPKTNGVHDADDVMIGIVRTWPGDEDVPAVRRLWASTPDHLLVLRALLAGVARWASGALYVGEHYAVCERDEFGVPALTDQVRGLLLAALERRPT